MLLVQVRQLTEHKSHLWRVVLKYMFYVRQRSQEVFELQLRHNLGQVLHWPSLMKWAGRHSMQIVVPLASAEQFLQASGQATQIPSETVKVGRHWVH